MPRVDRVVASNFVVAPVMLQKEEGRKRVLRMPEKVSSPLRWVGDRPGVRERSRASADLVRVHPRLVIQPRYSWSDAVESPRFQNSNEIGFPVLYRHTAFRSASVVTLV